MTSAEDLVLVSWNPRYRVRIVAMVRTKLERFALCKKRGETGGVLVGYYTEDLAEAVITDASAPPPDSRFSAFTFFRGTRGLSEWLSKLWERNPKEYYLGEWHIHPATTAISSLQDKKQMLIIANDPRYRCPEPILLIMASHSKPPAIAGFIFLMDNNICIDLKPRTCMD